MQSNNQLQESMHGYHSDLKVMKKMKADAVREEQNNIGAQELLMPTNACSPEIWKESGTI